MAATGRLRYAKDSLFVILSEAKDLLFAARSRSLASLRMTIHKKFLMLPWAQLHHKLQTLLYQLCEFREPSFHIAAEVHAQRATFAVG